MNDAGMSRLVLVLAAALAIGMLLPSCSTDTMDEPPPVAFDQPGGGGAFAVVVSVSPACHDDKGRNVAAAFLEAKRLLAEGQPVRIVIPPGEYREWIGDIDFSQEGELARSTPLLIEGAGPEQTILSGAFPSEEFAPCKWSPVVGHDGLYAAPWPYGWPWDPGPWIQQFGVGLRSHTARREQVYLNGAPLRMRTIERHDWVDPDGHRGGPDGTNQRGAFAYRGMSGSLDDLAPGEFTVVSHPASDPALRGRVFLRLPQGMAWADVHAIDVPRFTGQMYKNFLMIKGKDNLTLRGLAVRHANAGLSVAAVEIREGRDIRVEDCRFSDNVNVGLGLKQLENVAVVRVRADRNGMMGINLGECRNVRIGRSTTCGNNWRGAWEEFLHWHPAGLKMGNCHQVVVDRHVAIGNHCGGLWNDVFCTDVSYRRCLLLANRRLGAMLELAKAARGGGYHVEDCAIGFNGATGVFISNVLEVSVTGSLLAANGGAEAIEAAFPDAQVAYKGHDRPGLIMVDQMKDFRIADCDLAAPPGTGVFGSVYTRTSVSDLRQLFAATTVRGCRIHVADPAHFAKVAADEWVPQDIFFRDQMPSVAQPGSDNHVEVSGMPSDDDAWIARFRDFSRKKGIPFPEDEVRDGMARRWRPKTLIAKPNLDANGKEIIE